MQPGCVFSWRAAHLGTASLARLTLAGIALYVAIDVVLAFLRPGYSLIYNAESDYGRGAWYWLMDLNFLLRCALSLAAVVALRRSAGSSGRTRAGLALLTGWAICSGLLAFFADDLEGQHQHGSGVVHLVLAFVAFTCVAVGTIVTSLGLRADPAWRRAAHGLLAVAVAGAIAYLLLGSALKRQHGPDGQDERIFLGLELLWIAAAAMAALARARPDEPRTRQRQPAVPAN